MKTNHLFTQNNKNILEKLIPEKELIIECNSVTDPNDIAFQHRAHLSVPYVLEHSFECELQDIKSQQREEETILFI